MNEYSLLVLFNIIPPPVENRNPPLLSDDDNVLNEYPALRLKKKFEGFFRNEVRTMPYMGTKEVLLPIDR